MRGQPPRPQLCQIISFQVGFLVAATISFAVLSFIGEPVGRSAIGIVPPLVRPYIVGSILLTALMLDLTDIAGKRQHALLSCKRQTPKRIAMDLGMHRAALAWGLDAGLGFTTYRMSTIYWVVALSALLSLAPWWIGAVYALGFLVPLAVAWLAGFAISGSSSPSRIAEICGARVRPARLLGAVVIGAIIGDYLSSMLGAF
ncbi:MAG: hypothetical protein C4345_12690 [Chloroflexota bacterium]